MNSLAPFHQIAPYQPDLQAQAYAALREKCEELEEKCSRLMEALAPCPNDWRFLGLSPYLSKFLSVLIARAPAMVTRENSHYALYGDADDAPELKIVDMFICKMRATLKEHGVEIATHWGAGHSLSFEAKETLENLRCEWEANMARFCASADDIARAIVVASRFYEVDPIALAQGDRSSKEMRSARRLAAFGLFNARPKANKSAILRGVGWGLPKDQIGSTLRSLKSPSLSAFEKSALVYIEGAILVEDGLQP